MIGFGYGPEKKTYGALRGHLPANLIALFKMRDYRYEDQVCHHTGVQFVSAVNSGRISDIYSLVTVQMKEDAWQFTIVDIGTILGLAHLIPEGIGAGLSIAVSISEHLTRHIKGRISEGICDAILHWGLIEGGT